VAEGDWISINSSPIYVPAVVESGTRICVGVRYQLVSTASALLQVRPYCHGVHVPGGLLEVSIPVNAGSGEEVRSVSFSTDATIDELRATLVTLPRYQVLAEGRRAVDLSWRGIQ
jgi:hypothetical protein